MTDTQKTLIEKLRRTGLGYKAIAKQLDLSTNTVKSYCRNHSLTLPEAGDSEPSEFCPVCKKPLVHLPHKRRKKFCSPKCRIAFWNQMKTPELRICKCCGKEYEIPRKDSKFCSHECYIRYRFHGGCHEAF